jgi:exodeoxyribonuclease-3
VAAPGKALLARGPSRNGRLGNLLGWLDETTPDIVCLQELKAPDEKFPAPALRAAGYGAVWHGQKSWNGVAILAGAAEPEETRRGLPDDPDDTHSRYVEAAVGGLIVGCLYLPNGNPAPGPKFDYKLRWFERLTDYAQTLLDSGAPVILAGDFNVMPTELDVYAPERWADDALFSAGGARRLSPPCGAGPDRRAAGAAPGRADLHLLEIFPECVRPRRRIAHRSSLTEPCGCRAPPRRRGRTRGARPRCSRERSSDYAPVWIELTDTGAGAMPFTL